MAVAYLMLLIADLVHSIHFRPLLSVIPNGGLLAVETVGGRRIMSLLTSVEGDAVRKTIVDGYKATDQVCSRLRHVCYTRATCPANSAALAMCRVVTRSTPFQEQLSLASRAGKSLLDIVLLC